MGIFKQSQDCAAWERKLVSAFSQPSVIKVITPNFGDPSCVRYKERLSLWDLIWWDTLSYFTKDKPKIHKDKVPANVTVPVYIELPPRPQSRVSSTLLQSNSLQAITSLEVITPNFATIRNFVIDSSHPQDNDYQTLGNPRDKYSGKGTVLSIAFLFLLLS